MSETVFVVYTDGPEGFTYPYGVFDSRGAAQEAREAIIQELESGAQREDAVDMVHSIAGTFDEQVTVNEYEIRDGFEDGGLDELFEDYNE